MTHSFAAPASVRHYLRYRVLPIAAGMAAGVAFGHLAYADTPPSPALQADSLSALWSALKGAAHVPANLTDLMTDLVLGVITLSLLSTGASALANKIPATTKFGKVVHAVALNLSEMANTAKAIEASVVAAQKVNPSLIAVPLPAPKA